MVSNIDHPQHYGGADNPYEVIKVLEAWLTPEEFRGFLKGNIHKYLARSNKKGGAEDGGKAAWYAAYLAEFDKRFPPSPDGAIARQLNKSIHINGVLRGILRKVREHLIPKDATKIPAVNGDLVTEIDDVLRMG